MANKMLVEINHGAIMARIKCKWGAGLYGLCSAIREDCNDFVPVDKGTLRASSYSASVLSQGKIIWNTPYARIRYFTGAPKRIINPKASLMWCEKAKAQHMKDWERAASLMLGGGVSGK